MAGPWAPSSDSPRPPAAGRRAPPPGQEAPAVSDRRPRRRVTRLQDETAETAPPAGLLGPAKPASRAGTWYGAPRLAGLAVAYAPVCRRSAYVTHRRNLTWAICTVRSESCQCFTMNDAIRYNHNIICVSKCPGCARLSRSSWEHGRRKAGGRKAWVNFLRFRRHVTTVAPGLRTPWVKKPTWISCYACRSLADWNYKRRTTAMPGAKLYSLELSYSISCMASCERR